MADSNSAISVIIPLYNKSAYIARALDSVFSQTFTNFEVIVIDDGSTDSGPDIVRKYNDGRLHLIQQENQGPGAARNRGIQESKAELLAFLDADDEWMTEFLEKSYNHLANHPDCNVCACSYVEGVEKANFDSVWKSSGIVEGKWQLKTDSKLKVLKDAVNFLSSSSILYKRGVLTQFGGFYEKDHCTYGEDSHLFLQIVLNCRLYTSIEPSVWIHSDASDLGVRGRKTICPPRPMLTDPESVRRCCPSEYRTLLEKYLAYHALLAIHRHLAACDLVTCLGFPEAFPLMKTWRWEYTKVRFKIMFPRLIPLVRCLKGKVFRKRGSAKTV